MDKRPTLVFIASRFPYPLEKGDKLRGYNLIKGLSKTHQIHLIALTNEPINQSWHDEIAPYVVHIDIFPLHKIGQWIRLVSCIFTQQPFQLAYFTSFNIKRKVKKRLSEINPDHIFCQMIRPAEYVKNYHRCYKTIDYMDTLSIGMERRAKKAPWYTRWIYHMEAARLKEYEQRIFNYFEFQTMISQQDVHYIAHPDQRKIKVIPNGIDTDFFHPMENHKTMYDLVFVGNLSYAPNIDAMRWFATHVLSREPQWRLLIAGANPSSAFIQSLKKYRNIVIEGWQPDIRSAYSKGTIFIAPMQIGTGMQNKILEGMSMGLPCVTTSLVANAFESNQRTALVVADSNADIANEILSLLNNSERSENLARKGEEMVKTSFSWQSSVDLLESLFVKK